MSQLARTLAIRHGEGRLVTLVSGAFAAVEAGRGLGEVGVDTLVATRIGTDIFPILYIGLGIVGLVVSLTYSMALSRSTSQAFFPLLLLCLAGVLTIEWLIALSGAEAILPLVWISVYAAGLVLLTAIWTVGGFTFDARQAKRLFPLLTSAAIVGSLAGYLLAIVVQRLIGAEALILGEAVLFIVAAGMLRGLGARLKPRRATEGAVPSMWASLGAGASYVAGSPLMRLVAISYVLLAVLMFSVTYPFMTAMRQAFPDESEMLTMLALFSAGMTVASFLIGTLLANRLYTRWGVATVAVVLPVVYVLGFGIWLVRFGLITAVVVRFTQQVTQRGVSNAAFSAFYSIIPGYRRGQVIAFMDGVPGQLGTILSGVLLIVASSLALEQVFSMGLVTAAICVVVLVLTRRAYAANLVATLREGRAEQLIDGGPGLDALASDARVIGELREAAGSERPQDRLLAVDLLGRLGAREAVPEVARLCTDADARVRAAALSAMAQVDGAAAFDLLIIALGDDHADVRVAALTNLGDLGRAAGIPPARLSGLVTDDDPRVRAGAAAVLATTGRSGDAATLIEGLLASTDGSARTAGLHAIARLPEDAAARLALDLPDLLRFLDDPDAGVRAAAAGMARSRAELVPHVLQVLERGSDRARGAALLALEGHADEARSDLLAWADGELQRAAELRAHGAALARAEQDATASYLGQVIARREAAIEARLLQALAVLGAPEAVGLIRRCLHAPDAEIRAQAIEALDALADPGLARGVVRLLDREMADGPADGVAIGHAAAALRDDPDRWVRELALRTLSELAEEGEDAMPEKHRLVSDIDRMLVLRRVPIFGALDPEDLQRVATAAVEHTWWEGDALMVEGDIGSELIVIVEGSVRVVHQDGTAERRLRTYGEGDHIGELAVLREAPRAATVIAEPPGVRGLVIDGEAIHALLRERPSAAMAMLATLAERISQER